MKDFQEYKIDFDHLEKLDDLQVVPGTAEDSKAFSEFLKARKAKEAAKKARGIPSPSAAAARKKAK